jgi:hypothetical protein
MNVPGRYCVRLRWLFLLVGGWFGSVAALQLVYWWHGKAASPFATRWSTVRFLADIALGCAGNLTWQVFRKRNMEADATPEWKQIPFGNDK